MSMSPTTKALIVVFDEPIPEEDVEELLDLIEFELEDAGANAHVEHFTEKLARELIGDAKPPE